MSLPHDLGGDRASFGAIQTDAIDLQPWEQQCHSLFAVLATKGHLGTDQLRRAIEDLTPAQYADWGYYEKWTAAMVSLLIESGAVSHRELNRALFGGELSTAGGEGGEAATTPTPLYRPGDAVRVRSYYADGGVEYRRPHVRTPGYVYGVRGRVSAVCGRYADPSLLAFGVPDVPQVWLYRVEVSMADLWPERNGGGESGDTVSVEIYEHWLQPSDAASGRDFEGARLLNHDDASGRDCAHRVPDRHRHHGHDHEGHHDPHGHDGADHHEGHPHDPRPQVELRAVEREGPPRPGKCLFQALLRIVLEKEMISRDEIRRMMEALDTAGRKLNGATLVVKAWMDPQFKERLLQNPAQAAEEVGIQTANPNAPTVLTVVENTPEEHNLVVCTLCSCYPSSLLGIAPSWYKSSEYRSRAVREPRKVLEEFGTVLPAGKLIRVHDSTADHRYLVLPERPESTDGWSEEELRKLITRDSMIGVTTLVASN